jgi:hypothetical protein
MEIFERSYSTLAMPQSLEWADSSLALQEVVVLANAAKERPTDTFLPNNVHLRSQLDLIVLVSLHCTFSTNFDPKEKNEDLTDL